MAAHTMKTHSGMIEAMGEEEALPCERHGHANLCSTIGASILVG
jgi:hypothetical protein